MKKKSINSKGFTLIEILAAVTIIGILAVISVVSVSKVINQAKEKHYSTAENELALAGQNYVQDNRNELPKVIGQKKVVKLKTLVDKNYIQEITDYSDNKCDLDNSYVQIFKYSQTDYSYLPYLDCPGYTTTKIEKSSPTKITITFSEEKASDAKANITIKDSNKLMSYSYTIYKGDTEVNASGSIEVANYDTKVTKSVSIAAYTPGKIKVVVTATNIYGNTTTLVSTKELKDNVPPKCIIKDEDLRPKKWLKNGDRTITVGCSDEGGSGCVKSEYTKTFTDSATTGIITIADKEGNKTDCEVTVYIDKGVPAVTVNAYKRNKDGTKTGDAIASVSTKEKLAEQTMDLSTLTTTGWLNENDYPYGVYYEVKINADGERLDYSIKSNNSGLKESSSSVDSIKTKVASGTAKSGTKTVNFETEDDGYRKYKIKVEDEVGNSSTINIIAPLDRKAPSTPSVKLYKWKNNDTRPDSSSGLDSYTSSNWSNLNIYTKASGSSDSLSDVSYQYTTTGETANKTDEPAKVRSIEAEGTSTIKYRACDEAGNCSKYTSEYEIKLDKTDPTCTNSGDSTEWTTGNRTITYGCSDSGSGCNTSYDGDSKTFKTSTKTVEIDSYTIKDKAGNKVTCPKRTANVYIDKTAPTCSTTGDSKTWTNQDRTITYGCSDEHSGCTSDSESGSQTFTTTTKTATLDSYKIKDNVGNETECGGTTVNVYVDKTAPTCTTTKSPDDYWTNQNVTLKGTCEDDDSGCEEETVKREFTEETDPPISESPGTVKDKAGNETTCSKKWVRIDKTPPYITTVSLDSAYTLTWDHNHNLLESGQLTYIKEYDCEGIYCEATLCLRSAGSGAFSVRDFYADYDDDLSGPYDRDREYIFRDKNGYLTGSGSCLLSRRENPCTYEWYDTIYDAAGNSARYNVVTFNAGYINYDFGC